VEVEPRRLRAVLAYDGTAYAGWQRQRDVLSVQHVLEAALERVTGVAASTVASGRTDAGVHAEGQVVAVDTRSGLPCEAVQALCNQALPRDVALRAVEEAPAGFHPQRDALRKLYRYTLRLAPASVPSWSRRAWQLAGPLDLDAVRAGAEHLRGTHDFRGFRTDPGPERRDEDTVRTIESLEVAGCWELVRVEVAGPGFLYMMVRNLTAALVEVGLGRRPPGWIAELLRARDRSRLPPPAPAAGLTLVRVECADGYGAVEPGSGDNAWGASAAG
jgi:tRNA pseudouridine38-40 synthase